MEHVTPILVLAILPTIVAVALGVWTIWTEWPTDKNLARKRKASATHVHYKGGYYKVIDDNVEHTETHERMVVYRHVWPHELGPLKARPYANFYERLADGRERFQWLPVPAATAARRR